jgi:hypothetical protein
VAFNLRNGSFVKELDFTPEELKLLRQLSADLRGTGIQEYGEVGGGPCDRPARGHASGGGQGLRCVERAPSSLQTCP